MDTPTERIHAQTAGEAGQHRDHIKDTFRTVLPGGAGSQTRPNVETMRGSKYAQSKYSPHDMGCAKSTRVMPGAIEGLQMAFEVRLRIDVLANSAPQGQ